MLWLIVSISAYIILAAVYLVDKYLLNEGIPEPKVFAFYVGSLGILVFFLVPFTGFYIPGVKQIAISLLAGFCSIYALFWFYKDLRLFETSRVVPAIGGMVPLFTFGLIYLFSFGQKTLSFSGIIAFILLIFGSVAITLPLQDFSFKKFLSTKKRRIIRFRPFKFSIVAAFLFSLSFTLDKYVYLSQPFWNGFIWIRVGGFLMAVAFFILFPGVRKEVFKKRGKFKKKTAGIFLSSQAASGGASILQNWAIALAPIAYVAVINALQGIQYVFLFIFTVFLSLKFPEILREKISKKIIIQKITSILIICAGLAILVLK